jgi:hypothetical protein
MPRPGDLRFRVPRIFRTASVAPGNVHEDGADAGEEPRVSFDKAPALSLDRLLQRLNNLPPQTAILGVCDDELPVLLDLADPAPGALLVACDDRDQRFNLLHTLIQTSAALNSPRSVQFLVLSSQPQEWQNWLGDLEAARHCLAVEGLQEGNADRWLLKLSGWADQRRTGTITGPAVLLVVDDLSAATQLEYDARVNFDWLVKEGPAVKIWPVTASSAEALPTLSRWVRLFKSRVFGYAADPSIYSQLVQAGDQEPDLFSDESQFAIRIQDSWLKFRIPS